VGPALLNEVLAGRELFSDAPADDGRWLRIIFEIVFNFKITGGF
jgi:hypothetical protein